MNSLVGCTNLNSKNVISRIFRYFLNFLNFQNFFIFQKFLEFFRNFLNFFEISAIFWNLFEFSKFFSFFVLFSNLLISFINNAIYQVNEKFLFISKTVALGNISWIFFINLSKCWRGQSTYIITTTVITVRKHWLLG